MPPTQKYKKKIKNEYRQKYVIFEVFRQNELHHWIQRYFLHIVAPVKIDNGHFFEHVFFLAWDTLKTVKNKVFDVED